MIKLKVHYTKHAIKIDAMKLRYGRRPARELAGIVPVGHAA